MRRRRYDPHDPVADLFSGQHYMDVLHRPSADHTIRLTPVANRVATRQDFIPLTIGR